MMSMLDELALLSSYSFEKKYDLLFSPRTIPAIGAIFLEERTAIRTFSGLKKRDVRQLYHDINRKINAKSWIWDSKFGLPTYSETKYALKKSESKLVSILTKALNSLSRFRVSIARKMYQKLPRPMKTVVKKIGRIEAKVHKKLVCLTPKLKRRFGHLFYPNGQRVPKELKKKRSIFPDFEFGDPKGTFYAANKFPN